MNKNTANILPFAWIAAASDAAHPADHFGMELGAPEWIKAEGDADGDKPAMRKFRMNAYTGGPMNVGFGIPVVIDLESARAAQTVAVLRQHNPNQIVGHTTGVDISAKRLAAEAVISGTSEYAKEVVGMAANGFPWQLSVGGGAQMQYVDKGDSVTVNGRDFKGPLYVARKFQLREISFVPMGADDKTNARLAAALANTPESTVMNFESWLKAKGFDINQLADAQKQSLRAWYEAEIEAENKPDVPKARPAATAASVTASAGTDVGTGDATDIVASVRANASAEMTRIAEINKACGAEHADIAAKAVSEGWTVDKTKLEVLMASKTAPVVGSGTGGGGAAGLDHATVMAALCMSAGMRGDDLVKEYGEKAVEAASKPRMRGFGIHGLIHTVLAHAGDFPVSGRMDDDTIRAAFQANAMLKASGSGASSISLDGSLGAVANKAMMRAFTAFASVCEQFCSTTDVPNFQLRTKYRLAKDGIFLKVGPTGELKDAELNEQAYTNQVETYGRLLTLTRQDIINDDLGQFLQLPALFGRNAALAREKLVFELLLSNPGSPAFYSTANKNYIEGADTALSIDGLTAGEQKFLDQVDHDGHPISIMPRILLVPTSLKVTAELLMSERMINETTTANKGRPAANPHAGKFTTVASPYLNSQALAGQSSTAWYLFADPADVPAIELSYLRGLRSPTIESGSTDFDTLGMRWRGFWDLGADLQDPRGSLKSKGAA